MRLLYKEADKTATVEVAETLEISNDGFGPVATERLQEIEKKLAEYAQAAGGSETEGDSEAEAV